MTTCHVPITRAATAGLNNNTSCMTRRPLAHRMSLRIPHCSRHQVSVPFIEPRGESQLLHSTTEQMPLFKLPNELLISIAEYLDVSGINNLSRTNRRLCILLTSLLHDRMNHDYVLLWAAKHQRKALLEIALEKGADIEAADDSGRNALSWAAASGYNDIMFYLLDWGADIESKDSLTMTALHRAAIHGSERTVTILLERGANVAACTSVDDTALHWASFHGHLGVARILLDAGAPVDAKGGQLKYTPLISAAYTGWDEVVKLLLDYKAEISAHTNQNDTALHYAVAANSTSIANILLDRGASIESPGSNQITPLGVAAHRGHLEVAKMLRQRGGNILARNVEGQTPLHLATRDGHVDMVRQLLDDGADLTAQDKQEGQILL
ncbi:ankyrin repeat-containing domain protein [Morchella snyderi]|nr:ankyrin repeat-containing domain protein [Morchella snyderi]